MFKRLQQKWKINGWRLALVIITFAIGGSLTGYVGEKLMKLFHLQHGVLWIVIYILLVILLWPLMVIIISIPFGQFRFFKKYIRRMAVRMKIMKSEVGNQKSEITSNQKHIAIFASGAGSNAQKIIDHFRNSDSVRISLIVCNNPSAGVLKIAEKENIEYLLIDKERFFRGNGYTDELKNKNIGWIVLAGFLWKIPASLLKAYPQKIINIHPALLPKYGGKGMYGNKVHEAVIANNEKQSGITIHYVDEIYDHGKTIFQATCDVFPNDTADALAQRIHILEHQHYPVVIEQLLNSSHS